jgi:hypothetical protein
MMNGRPLRVALAATAIVGPTIRYGREKQQEDRSAESDEFGRLGPNRSRPDKWFASSDDSLALKPGRSAEIGDDWNAQDRQNRRPSHSFDHEESPFSGNQIIVGQVSPDRRAIVSLNK